MTATVPALFPRDARLLAGVDFSRVFDGKKRVSHPLMSLHWFPRESGQGGARLGLAVSRKVDARAVVRNRIKRRLRDDFRHLRPTLAALDLVVVARRDAASASGAELAAAFSSLLQRAGALPDPGPDGTMSGSPREPAPSVSAHAPT